MENKKYAAISVIKSWAWLASGNRSILSLEAYLFNNISKLTNHHPRYKKYYRRWYSDNARCVSLAAPITSSSVFMVRRPTSDVAYLINIKDKCWVWNLSVRWMDESHVKCMMNNRSIAFIDLRRYHSLVFIHVIVGGSSLVLVLSGRWLFQLGQCVVVHWWCVGVTVPTWLVLYEPAAHQWLLWTSHRTPLVLAWSLRQDHRIGRSHLEQTSTVAEPRSTLVAAGSALSRFDALSASVAVSGWRTGSP